MTAGSATTPASWFANRMTPWNGRPSGVEDVIEALDRGDRARERGTDEAGFARIEDRAWPVPALATLPERAHDPRLRFFDGLPRRPSRRVGISRLHVSRLLSRSLAELRRLAPHA